MRHSSRKKKFFWTISVIKKKKKIISNSANLCFVRRGPTPVFHWPRRWLLVRQNMSKKMAVSLRRQLACGEIKWCQQLGSEVEQPRPLMSWFQAARPQSGFGKSIADRKVTCRSLPCPACIMTSRWAHVLAQSWVLCDPIPTNATETMIDRCETAAPPPKIKKKTKEEGRRKPTWSMRGNVEKTKKPC